MSHFRTSMQGKMRVLIDTMCRYDHWMFGNTRSLSALMYRSLCGTYSRYSSRLIMLKISPHCGSAILDPVVASISPKAGAWMKTFFIIVLMTGSGLGIYSNCLTIHGEETSPICSYFSFGALGERLVVGFVGGIFPAT
jgi:hypothetical protein